MIKTNPQLKIFSKNLRRNATDAERRIWQYLRSKQFYGLKFRRQQIIGKYIVDFVCFSRKIIIELDGGQHNERDIDVKDKLREQWLRKQGFKILRFWNNDVLQNIKGVWDEILKNCNHPHQTSPIKGEERRNFHQGKKR